LVFVSISHYLAPIAVGVIFIS
jgi:hypothetical protein